MRNDYIQLMTVTGMEKDSAGFLVGEVVKYTPIFAEIKSVGRIEFYEALRSGMKVSVIFSISSDDFNMATVVGDDGKKIKPTKILYNDTTYNIQRSYKLGLDKLELTCEEVE